jgi:hypothetical protein
MFGQACQTRDAAVVFVLCIPEQMIEHLGKELLNLSDHVSAK